jgi:hypothetical protein
MARRDATSVKQNAEFFAHDKHGRDAAEIGPYRSAEALTHEVAGTKLVLNVGNGGVFESPVGRRLTQFGRRWPAALTPARVVLIVGRKPGADV